MPAPEPNPPPSAPDPEIEPPTSFVTLPPALSTTPSCPEIWPVFSTVLLLASEMPLPLAAETTPALPTVQLVPVPPSMPSEDPVEVTLPVLVIVSGLVNMFRTTGPVVLLLIVLDIRVVSLMAPRRALLSRFDGRTLHRDYWCQASRRAHRA